MKGLIFHNRLCCFCNKPYVKSGEWNLLERKEGKKGTISCGGEKNVFRQEVDWEWWGENEMMRKEYIEREGDGWITEWKKKDENTDEKAYERLISSRHKQNGSNWDKTWGARTREAERERGVGLNDVREPSCVWSGGKCDFGRKGKWKESELKLPVSKLLLFFPVTCQLYRMTSFFFSFRLITASLPPQGSSALDLNPK